MTEENKKEECQEKDKKAEAGSCGTQKSADEKKEGSCGCGG